MKSKFDEELQERGISFEQITKRKRIKDVKDLEKEVKKSMN